MIPPDKSKGAFMPCHVNGVLSYALLDTGAEAGVRLAHWGGIVHRIW